MILDKLQQPNDIKKLSDEELSLLPAEIRNFLLEAISNTGGHLASNLGVVELTMALHLTFDLPEDKIIWDVGHQSYTHKLLTGRREGFDSLRQYHGMSGFPKYSESPCDPFNTGHSSTSISAGLGMAKARELQGKKNYVISVIGDGSLTGGMAYEALNNASCMKSNFIIVLNDNRMSISENVGGMSRYLARFRTADKYKKLKKGVKESINHHIPKYGKSVVQSIHNTKNTIKTLFIPGMFFEEIGIMYIGPVDGHNLRDIRDALEEAKRVDGPVLVHVLTSKGKGYGPAEKHPSRFHGADPFDVRTGLPKKKKQGDSWTDVFGKEMLELAKKEPRLAAITAAMSDGTGLTAFAEEYPDRFFDVGIAEGHAVTFAAGLSRAGLVPVFAVYSSFLQRGYDQLIHDVCIQDLHVVFAVDRAGLVGADGETHQGIFDLSYLSCMPNMTVMCPKNDRELRQMLDFAVCRFDGPVAIRYPRGMACATLQEWHAPVVCGKAELLHRGSSRIAVMALGSMVEVARKAIEGLDMDITFVNARFAAPFDVELIEELAEDHDLLVTVEENILSGSMGQKIAAHVEGEQLKLCVMPIALPDGYVEHGNVDLLRRDLRIDEASIRSRIRDRAEELHLM